MKNRKLVVVAVVLAILLLAALLNPSADQHRDRIRSGVAERSQLEQVLGVGEITAFASSYKSLGVASYTTFNGKVVSIGIFGMVFFVG
jgi:hypothetical protein